MTDYLTLNYLLYLTRWLISGVIAFIPLYFLIKYKCCEGNKYAEYIHLLITQFALAFLFYKVDKWILS